MNANTVNTQFSEVELPVVDTILQHVERIYSRLEKIDISQVSSQLSRSNSQTDDSREVTSESGYYSHHRKSTLQLESVNSSLRNEIRSLKEKIFELERKLDMKGLELAEQISNSEVLLAQVRQDAALWREKYAALCQDRQEDRADLETIRNYIGTLPTHDELTSRKLEVAKYRSECESMKKELEESKRKSNVHLKVTEELRSINEDLQTSLADLQIAHDELLARWHQKDSLKKFSVSELEEEYLKLDSELKSVKKVAAHREKRFKMYREDCELKAKELEERLSLANDGNTRCHQQLQRKEGEVEILQQRIEGLERENHKNTDAISIYRRQLNQLLNQEDVRQEELEVSNHLALKSQCCSRSLESVVRILRDWQEGMEPDLEQLFVSSDCGLFSGEPVDCLKALLVASQNVDGVQKHVNYLRSFLNEQYARHLGNRATNMTCIQQ